MNKIIYLNEYEIIFHHKKLLFMSPIFMSVKQKTENHNLNHKNQLVDIFN